nr:FxsA family protein [Alphaproteobacteria bacterium]
MRIALLLVFIAVPLLEIALLIKAGDQFGFWPTITIIIFTAVLGTLMLRLQGMSVVNRASQALRACRLPVESVADGVFLLLAGAFLLTPGLVTDGVGLALLVPAVRQWIGNKIWIALRSRMQQEDFGSENGEPGGSTAGQASTRSFKKRRSGVVIDADFKDID